MDKSILNWSISVFGALAWLSPMFYDFFRNPVLKHKMLSHFSSLYQSGEMTYLMHFVSLNIISLKKNFQIDEVEINIKYSEDSEYTKGTLFWDIDREWTINGQKCKLKLKPEDTIPFMPILPRDITKNVCLTFRVQTEYIKQVDLLELVLVEYTGRIYRLNIDFAELNPELLVWDSRNWTVM